MMGLLSDILTLPIKIVKIPVEIVKTGLEEIIEVIEDD